MRQRPNHALLPTGLLAQAVGCDRRHLPTAGMRHDGPATAGPKWRIHPFARLYPLNPRIPRSRLGCTWGELAQKQSKARQRPRIARRTQIQGGG
jgi:hypothetical protein